MGYIKEIKIGNGTANLIEPILYGTTNTAAGTQAKVVSISNFELVTGVTIAVKFTVTNTHATPQLNVNSTGAKLIKYRGGNLPSAATLTANRVYQFVYDGTNWELIGDLDTNTQTITGVKGNAETNYRTGQVNLTAANIGAVSIDGNDTVSGNKTFSAATTLHPSSSYSTSSGTIISANANAIIQSPIPKYLWHDILGFCRATIPTYYTSTNGTSWTESTLEKRLFTHQEAWGNSEVLNSSIKGARWVWTNGGFYASNASWLVLGITYKNPYAYFDLLLETSADSGSTWTTLISSTNLHYAQMPIWIRNTEVTQNGLRLTITWNNNSASNASLGICSIRFLTSRWGDQGKGSEFEYPYQWNKTPDIYPIANNVSNLGTSTMKWANIYATTFTGNLTGNVSGTATNVTGTVAIGNGGTGATTASAARTNLGLGSIATKAATDYLPYKGNVTALGSGSPHTSVKAWWENTTNVPKLSVLAAYNNSGAEKTLIFSKGNADTTYGTVLAWGYTDKYLRILRKNNASSWISSDWEKIDAGYADSAGSVALSGVSGADDLKAIEAISETSGFLKKTAANTWTLDTNTYLTSSTGVTSVAGKTGEVTLADLGLSNAMHFLGVTTTNISTGTANTTATVSISGSNVTAAAGDVVLYGSQEYVWGNSKWNLLGDESSYALKSTTLSGYGITDAKITNGVITLGNTSITPLTSSNDIVIEKTSPLFTLHNEDITRGITPSANIYTSIQFKSKKSDNKILGVINNLYQSDGIIRMEFLTAIPLTTNDAVYRGIRLFHTNENVSRVDFDVSKLSSTGVWDTDITINKGTETQANSFFRVSAGDREIWLFANNLNGNLARGIWLPATGTGAGKSVISVDDNNNIYYNSGTMTGELTVNAAASFVSTSTSAPNYIYFKNTAIVTTSPNIVMQIGLSSNNQYHGIYSQGYYNGTSFTPTGGWLIGRNAEGTATIGGSTSSPMGVELRGNTSVINGYFFVGLDSDTVSRSMYAASNSGRICLYSTGNSSGNGNRGVWITRQGSNGQEHAIVSADANNQSRVSLMRSSDGFINLYRYDVTRGTAPSAAKYWSIGFHENYSSSTKRLALIDAHYNTDGSISVEMMTQTPVSTNENDVYRGIMITQNPDKSSITNLRTDKITASGHLYPVTNSATTLGTDTNAWKQLFIQNTSGSNGDITIKRGSSVFRIGYGTGDTNYGLYDAVTSQWMIYSDGTKIILPAVTTGTINATGSIASTNDIWAGTTTASGGHEVCAASTIGRISMYSNGTKERGIWIYKDVPGKPNTAFAALKYNNNDNTMTIKCNRILAIESDDGFFGYGTTINGWNGVTDDSSQIFGSAAYKTYIRSNNNPLYHRRSTTTYIIPDGRNNYATNTRIWGITLPTNPNNTVNKNNTIELVVDNNYLFLWDNTNAKTLWQIPPIVYSTTTPSSPTEGMIWLQPIS